MPENWGRPGVCAPFIVSHRGLRFSVGKRTMLTEGVSLRRSWTRAHGNVCDYLCSFSKNLDSFQNKKVLNAVTKTYI